ncbi:CHAT domain-containing protein [Lasiosphaeria miniovina]|uniref:CHAT domain-containing protein n=1 Tax=Lasiosphaeria miniovina TaxID=1954250 RepID=A0AA39ZU71_9PEZI|nr:CHAT domain-containing protein [Lasiosphaeria miniovina]KAK0703692.1 CHAT domain-containing protein [Lasiosphaeria miniovina]
MESPEEHAQTHCARAGTLLQRYTKSHSDQVQNEQLSLDALAELDAAASRTGPSELSERITQITALGASIHLERLLRMGLKPDADAAESGLRALLGNQQPASASYCLALTKLLTILHIRYERTADRQFVLESLDLVGSAIASVGRDDAACLPGLLGACGQALIDLSECANSPSALEMAIDVLRAAAGAAQSSKAVGSSEWVLTQQTLAEALRRRFEATGGERDIAEAQAIFDGDDSNASLSPRETLSCLMARLRVLHSRWRLCPGGASLKTLIMEYSQANQLLVLNDQSPIRPELFQATGAAFNEMSFDPNHKRGVAFASILGGYRAGEELLSTWDEKPADCPGFAPYLFAMGKAWELQFHAYYSPEALGVAHGMFSQCLRLTSPDSSHYALRAAAMIGAQRMKRDLGFAGDKPGDESAIKTLTTVLLGKLPLEAKAKAAVATELGYTALRQYDSAAAAAAAAPQKTSSWLDQAIRHFRKAVSFSCTDKLSQVYALKTLADVLATRANSHLQRDLKELALKDCDDALHVLDRLAAACQDIKVNLQERYDTLGDVREVQFKIHGDQRYAENAIEAWEKLYAGTDGVSISRLMTATKAAALQQRISGDHGRAARVYRSVVLAFLQVVSPSDTRSEQIWKLRLLGRLNVRALSEALMAGWPAEEVLEVAEQCRSVIWNLVLGRKASAADLEARHRALAARFVKARTLLARSPKAAAGAAAGDRSWGGLLASNQFHTADEYNEVLAEIRQQPGFEDFLLPGLSAERLLSVSSEGPVVLFVQSNVSSHAVVVSQAGVLVEPLPDFSQKRCEEHYTHFNTFLEARQKDPARAGEVLEDLLHWLWDAAAGPVVSALAKAGICRRDPQPTGSRLPRLWWVSSGWISVFPIHAAGEYSNSKNPKPSERRRHVFDFFVSSYTPSLGALEYARRTMHRMSSNTVSATDTNRLPEAALVSMRFTPDVQPDLEHAASEVREAEAMLRRGYKVTTMGHPREEFQAVPYRKPVVQALRTCEVAHFACHGVADPLEPLRSRLLLCDWKGGHSLTVGFLMRIEFRSCRLVNLSACDMAVNRDLLLREEGLHVAGAFQMAGVPNVLATMWPIVDAVAPQVSRHVYSELLGSGERLQVANVAESLHKAVMGLMKSGESVAVWGPYVHFGA